MEPFDPECEISIYHPPTEQTDIPSFENLAKFSQQFLIESANNLDPLTYFKPKSTNFGEIIMLPPLLPEDQFSPSNELSFELLNQYIRS